MPESAIYTVDVIGRDPTDPAAWDAYLTDLYSRQYDPATYDNPAPPQEAFLPPEPVLLPEVVVTQPKPAPRVPIEILPEIGGAVLRTLGTAAAGITALLLPQPLGPAEFDEAPTPPSKPPAPPGATDPLEPPNWGDIAREPYKAFPTPKEVPDFGALFRWSRYLEFLRNPTPKGPQVPVLDEFELNPPAVTTRSNPLPTWLDLPYARPDFGLNFGIDPGFGSAPSPISTPGINPLPGLADPFAQPSPNRRASPSPDPAITGAPDLFGSPLPDIIGNPLGDRSPSPTRTDAAGPRDFIGRLDPIGSDAFTPKVGMDPMPLPEFEAQPIKRKKDDCTCTKKPKKPRMPRAVCYEGTYIQRAKGTVFRPQKEVPCDQKLPRSKGTARRRNPNSGKTIGDLAKDIFNLP